MDIIAFSTLVFSILIVVLIVILLIKVSRKTESNEKLDFMKEDLLKQFVGTEGRMSGVINNQFVISREETQRSAKQLREEVRDSLSTVSESNLKRINEMSQHQKNLLDAFSGQINELTKSSNTQFNQFREGLEQSLEKVRSTVEQRLESIQKDNNAKLEKMRETVDEKLHKTLEDRLGRSFELVSKHLEAVQKGLGEMQHLATGVGDLKKVLSNVKTRGVLGEIQLGNILEQLLSPEQYSLNVSTIPNSRNHVEFAIKFPGKDADGKHIWLPIDSKFPLDRYEALQNAYDSADSIAIESARKDLVRTVKLMAKDIRDKYVAPPHTTDFGILFLPIEGLYAEVVRQPDMMSELQREYKIMLAGPSNLAAFLNALQMGFRSLAIEKRSSEVWKVLGAVKTEFSKFGTVLEKVQTKLNQASKTIESAGVRTRAIDRKLRQVEELPMDEANKLLEEDLDDSETPLFKVS